MTIKAQADRSTLKTAPTGTGQLAKVIEDDSSDEDEDNKKSKPKP